MTISPQELDRLEQQANVRLQWIEDVRNGVRVAVECRLMDPITDWYPCLNSTVKWHHEYDYRLIYPEAKKREPKDGDKIFVRDYDSAPWHRANFSHFSGKICYAITVGSKFTVWWNHWKFPEDPDPVIPDESELPTIEQVQAVYSSKSNPVPEPKKRVPLTAEDWKGVWWVRLPHWINGAMQIVIAVSERSISTYSDDTISYSDLIKDGWLRSQDGVTWLPCSREVES